MDRYLESLMVNIRRKQFPETVHATLEIVSRLLSAHSAFHIPGLGNNLEEDVRAMVVYYLFNADGMVPSQIAELEILYIIATTMNQATSPAVLRFIFSVNLPSKQVYFCKLLSLAFSLRLHVYLSHATALLEELRPDHVLQLRVVDALLSDFGPAKKQSSLCVGGAASCALHGLPQLCPRLARLLVALLMMHQGRLADDTVSLVADWVAEDEAPPPLVALTRWCLELHGSGHHDPSVTWKLHLAIMRRATTALTDKAITLEDVRSWLEVALCDASVAKDTTVDMLAQMLQAVMAAGLLKCDPGKLRQAILPHCPVQNRLLVRVLDTHRAS